MAVLGARKSILRPKRHGGEHHRVTFVELFFDLVFVFAVTQISHTMVTHLTPFGAAQAVLMLMAVWWVWIFTSWVTNWVDPDQPPVRLMLFVLMLAGLILSTSLPRAFGEAGLAFAIAYVVMQVGRSLFMLWATRQHHRANFLNFQRITAWLILSGLFWIAGGMAEGNIRFVLWLVALLIEFAGPSAGFWTPGLGGSATADWAIEGGHMAERCGLFVIIALGESVLVTGATFATLEWTWVNLAAFASAFGGSVAMWWIYFNIGAEKASHNISHAADPGRLARANYTYIHILLVAGIIVCAVADELTLAHPLGHADAAAAAAIVGGPAIYLVGNLLFKWSVYGRPPLSHMVGLALLGLTIPLGTSIAPLALGAAATAILITVAVWESISLKPSEGGDGVHSHGVET